MLGAVVVVLALLGVLAAVVVSVVWILRMLGDPPVLVEHCAVELDTGSGASRATLAPDQTAHAALFAAMAEQRGLPARAVTIAIATGMQESRLRNIDYGDRDSLGLFQQRPSQGWGAEAQVMDPVYATGAFYDVLVTIEGYPALPITEAAQAVQRSGFPDAYAQHERMSRLFASALTGHAPASMVCVLSEAEPAADDDLADVLAATFALLERDWGTDVAARAELTDSSLTVDLTGHGDDAERLQWAVAHWGVATAQETGIAHVAVDGLRWDRSAGLDAAWLADETAPAAGLVTLSP